MPGGVFDDRSEPDEDGGGGDPNRRERARERDEIASGEEEPNEREAAQREEQEQRIGRMDERERERGRRERSDQLHSRSPYEQDRECHDRWHDQLARGGRGQLERVVGASISGCERSDRHLPGQHREPTTDRVEERAPGLEG